MRRTLTGAAQNVPLRLMNRQSGAGQNHPREKDLGADGGAAGVFSRITVLPVDVGRKPRDEALSKLHPTNGTVATMAAVPVSSIDSHLLRQLGPDVILLDGRGARPSLLYRAIVRVRGAGWARGIILLLDDDALSIVPVASAVGATDFVIASASSAELEARLRRGAVQPTGADPRAAAVAETGIQLHWRTHQISFEGRSIGLTLRELQMLAVFMERGREVITANEVARLAWGESKRSGGALATTYVCSLRKKLAWFGGRFGIQTVHGVGYRFVI